MKLSSKAIVGITATSALLIATSTILANVLIKNNSTDPTKPINPLDRDNTYHHYSLVNKMMSNEKLNKLINFSKKDKTLVYFIDEDLFLENFKSIITDTFKTIPSFKQNYLNYEITCNYKIKDTKTILVDLVWKLPNSDYKYYDQFALNLETI